MTRMTETSHEELYKVIISHSVLLRMRNGSDKICRENQNALFIFNIFFPEKHTAYEVPWNNMVEPDKPHIAI